MKGIAVVGSKSTGHCLTTLRRIQRIEQFSSVVLGERLNIELVAKFRTPETKSPVPVVTPEMTEKSSPVTETGAPPSTSDGGGAANADTLDREGFWKREERDRERIR